MKNTMKKLTVLLVSTFLMMACGGVKESEDDSSLQAISSSEQTTSEQQSSSQEQSSKENTSSEQQSSSQEQSSKENTSSEQQGGEEFAYSEYLISHTEGQVAEYIFEAECTNLGGKEGPGYSGTSSEKNMAGSSRDPDTNEEISYVTYLYAKGLSVNFFIVSDRDVNDAELNLRLGAEFLDLYLDPASYDIRIDYPSEELLEDALESEDGALGYWDDLYLGIYDADEIINTWDCGAIEINAEGSSNIIGWSTWKITSHLSLRKGVTCISLITANNDNPEMGTMQAYAPVVDYLSIKTTAQLGMFDQQDNFQGTNGCHIKA